MINIVWATIIILCSIYTVSFAKYEFKEKKYASTIVSSVLVLVSVIIYVIKTGM